MKPLEWFKTRSKPVQALVIIVIVVALAVATVGAVVGTAVVGTFVMPAGEPADPPAPPHTTTDDIGPSSGTSTTASQSTTVRQSAPQMQFDLSAADGSATVTYVGGDSAEAGRLEVVVNGEVAGTWADLDDSHGESGRLTEEASITITDISSGDAIGIVWVPPQGESVVVARLPVH